jgi:hypothetical protein
MQKILSGDDVANEHTSDDNEIISIDVNGINLNNFFKNIYHHETPLVILSNIPTLQFQPTIKKTNINCNST